MARAAPRLGDNMINLEDSEGKLRPAAVADALLPDPASRSHPLFFQGLRLRLPQFLPGKSVGQRMSPPGNVLPWWNWREAHVHQLDSLGGVPRARLFPPWRNTRSSSFGPHRRELRLVNRYQRSRPTSPVAISTLSFSTMFWRYPHQIVPSVVDYSLAQVPLRIQGVHAQQPQAGIVNSRPSCSRNTPGS